MDNYQYQIKAVTVDAVIFSIIDKKLHCLLIKRKLEPFKDYWALPGGFLKTNESSDDAFKRELLEESGMNIEGLNYWKEFKTYSNPNRDPRNNNDYQIISIAYVGITNQELIEGKKIKIKGNSDALEADFISFDDIYKKFKKEIAFDHKNIISDGKEFIAQKIEKEAMALDFLNSEFTLTELRTVFEEFWGKQLHQSNFERKVQSIENFIIPTDKKILTGSNRPSKLYKKGAPKNFLILR